MRMSEKCLLVCCRKAVTTGFTHAATSPGPLVRITISNWLLLIAAGSCAAPLLLLQLDGLVTAASTTTLPFSVHLVLLQPSVHELREAEDACAIKTFCGFHAPLFLIPKSKSHVAEKKQTANTSSLHKQTRIAQNQEFFPLGHHWKLKICQLKIVFCAKSTTTTPWSTSLRAQGTIFVSSFKDFARMGMRLGFWFCIHCIAKTLQKNPKHNNKSMSASFQQVRVGFLIITWSLWSVVHGSSLSKSLLLEGRDLLRKMSSSFRRRLRKSRPVHCRSADGVWHAPVQWHCAWCSSTMAMP